MTIWNSPRSPAKTGEMNMGGVIGGSRLKIVRAPRWVPRPRGHDEIPSSLTILKERKPWEVRMMETTLEALYSASVQNSEWRAQVPLKLPL